VDPSGFESSRLANRRQKMLFQNELSNSGVSLYIDANVRAVASLAPLFEAFISSGADIGMYRHYARSSVRDEIRACVARNKVGNPDAIADELEFYNLQGFPDQEGMWEGSVIFKNHQSERLASAMDEWWMIYSRFQTRDQFSLPFVIWKHGLRVYDLDELPLERERYFVRLQHSTSGLANSLARYLQARAPENPLWRFLHGTAQYFRKFVTAGK
jgi:hypothetical protein